MKFHSAVRPCFIRQAHALGLAVGGLLIFVFGTAAAGFSGEWEAQFVFGRGPRPCEMEGELAILWTDVGWDVEGVFQFERSTWAQLDVETSVELDSIGFSWSTRWDAIDRRFERLTLETWAEREGIEIDADFDLYETRCWTDLRAQCDLGPCEIDVKARLGASKSFSFDFYRLDVSVSSEIRGTPADVEARWTAKNGFEWVEVEAVVSPLQKLPGMEIEVETRLTRTGREGSFEPVLEAWGACEWGSNSLELYSEIAMDDVLSVGGWLIVGMTGETAWENGWASARVSFGPTWNKKVVGAKEYGAALGLGYEGEGLRNRQVSIEAWAYAIDPSDAPPWDRTRLVIAIHLTSSWMIAVTVAWADGSVAETALDVELEW